MKEDSKK